MWYFFQFLEFNKFSNDYYLQMKWFSQFCGKNDGYENAGYTCEELLLSSFNDINFCNKYSILWNKFVLFRINFEYNTLNQLFISKLKIDISNLNYFNSFKIYYRNQFILLPLHGHDCLFRDVPNYKLIINHFLSLKSDENKTKNEKNVIKINGSSINCILVYYYIYNMLCNIINKMKSLKGHGFDKQLSKEVLGKVDNNQLCKLLIDYLVIQYAETQLFGRYYDEEPTLEENQLFINKCKLILFNNDLNELNKLIEYIIKNNGNSVIDNNLDCFNINITLNKYNKNESNNDGGISNIIINNLSYVIFNDFIALVSNNKNDMIFPKLEVMYKFLWNLTVYINCYPGYEMDQLFYLKQYFYLKNSVFNDIDESINKLSDYMYFNQYRNGTILHRASNSKFFPNYVSVLLDDGFDCQKVSKCGPTPITMAQDYNLFEVISIFQVGCIVQFLYFLLLLLFLALCFVFCVLCLYFRQLPTLSQTSLSVPFGDTCKVFEIFVNFASWLPCFTDNVEQYWFSQPKTKTRVVSI